MKCYAEKHNNLTYKKTNSYMFDNQLEALKLAKGDFLKFVNHRSIWIEGRLQYMIDFLEQYEDERPVIYFSNGVLNKKNVWYSIYIFIKLKTDGADNQR